MPLVSWLLYCLHEQVSEASPPVSPFATTSSDKEGGGSVEGLWVHVNEIEGSVEGTATINLRLLNVEKLQEGQYRCRVTYKGCTVFSQPATLTVLEDGEEPLYSRFTCTCIYLTLPLCVVHVAYYHLKG